MKNILFPRYIILLLVIMASSCATKRKIELTERYPNKQVKSYQVITTYQKCRENCRVVKTNKVLHEYYDTGKIKSYEKTVNEESLDGDFHSSKIYSKYYDETGKIAKMIKKDDLQGKVYVYVNGKLKSKTSVAQ